MMYLIWIVVGLVILWLLLELIERAYLQLPLHKGFYSSIPRHEVRARQMDLGVKVVTGPGWIHLGWIANPDAERYCIDQQTSSGWKTIGRTKFGSFLWKGEGGSFRVISISMPAGEMGLIGNVQASPQEGTPPLFRPRLAGEWQLLFKPQKSGRYINDHTIYQDADGNWRLVGITSLSEGEASAEKHFAVGVCPDFPPIGMMVEDEKVADFGQLAWAPQVIKNVNRYHMFWSPHRMHQMVSDDGKTWHDHQVGISAPYHYFFRDPMVLQVAEGQWMLYCTARGKYFSRVDLYQSFDLHAWQYIGAALRTGWGSERNSPFASTESPTVSIFQGRYYLSVTYNNDSFFWPGILMLMHKWLNRSSYNDTLVFHADNPYEFGIYCGKKNAPSLITTLQAHAPEWICHPVSGQWYITTAGWPWITTLTRGEVAVAHLEWEPVELSSSVNDTGISTL